MSASVHNVWMTLWLESRSLAVKHMQDVARRKQSVEADEKKPNTTNFGGLMQHINQVTMTGTLTRDPELRALPSGASVCSMRIAVNESRKNGSTGEWTERANFFDVTAWGGTADACAKFLEKGKMIALSGQLEWREWETQEGQKRQAVQIVARQIQFISPKPSNGDGTASGYGDQQSSFASTAADDDIPF